MWTIGGKSFSSRLLLGTALYPSLAVMKASIMASKTNVITVSLKRQSLAVKDSQMFWNEIQSLQCEVLPNTAGCYTAQEAIMTAEMAREIFKTHWVKLEVIGDQYTLQPDPFELVKAAEALVKRGFEVFPYCTDDLIVCKRLLDCGCHILMPLAAPIGSGKGVLNAHALMTLRARLPEALLIIDAGIGKPSHASQVMEWGYDGVLLNTAVALAANPVQMASAFRHALLAGRKAYLAGLMEERNMAHPSTTLVDTPFWHQAQPNDHVT